MPARTENRVIGKADIENGLRQLGLQAGDVVEVHASLSHFGHVDGGADTVIRALVDTVTSAGSLMMSAYRLGKMQLPTEDEKSRGVLGIFEILGEHHTGPISTGIIAETFLRFPGTLASDGIGRVCAWGRYARQLINGYKELLKLNGWALFLGADIGTFSSMHQAEDRFLPDDIREYFRFVPEDIRQNHPGKFYISYRRPGDAWPKIEKEAERRGLIRRLKIGNADCMLFRAQAVVDIYAEALQKDPYAFYGIEKPAS